MKEWTSIKYTLFTMINVSYKGAFDNNMEYNYSHNLKRPRVVDEHVMSTQATHHESNIYIRDYAWQHTKICSGTFKTILMI